MNGYIDGTKDNTDKQGAVPKSRDNPIIPHYLKVDNRFIFGNYFYILNLAVSPLPTEIGCRLFGKIHQERSILP